MAKRLEIKNLRITYLPTWISETEEGTTEYEFFGFTEHEIHAANMPDDLRADIEAFVRKAEELYDTL